MKERGLLLTPDNRQLSRDGRMTRFRRVIKPQPDTSLWKPEYINKPKEWRRMVQLGPVHHGYDPNIWCLHDVGDSPSSVPYTTRKPRHQVGDHLYMLEPYKICPVSTIYRQHVIGRYTDNGDVFDVCLSPQEWERFNDRKKPYANTSSMFMYKSLARTWFEVTAVRCEQEDGVWYWVYEYKLIERE